jgi:membrane-bound lytic murein transglycosylase B
LAIEAEQYADLQRVQALRALNQGGGQLGAIETVFAAETPGEMAARWQLSQQVFDLLAHRSDEATGNTGAALAKVRETSKYADLQVASVDDVQAVYERLNSLLSQQQEILDELDARARRLAEAEEAAERLAAQRAAAAAAASSGASHVNASGIPRAYLALYQEAARTCPGLPWPVLAAIGQVESGHGTNTGPSSAGAQGPMQFLPSTFVAYAVDGDKDGDKDIWDPADAIYSAAKYLCANGAGVGPRALYNALWHYNHADWYVLMVANVAGQIARRFDEPVPQVQAS